MNNTWNHDDHRYIWHPFDAIDADNIGIESAEGIYLNTHDGKKIIDGISSWWVNLHGHGNPHIAKAIYKQALQLEHVIFAGFTHTPAIQLSKSLIQLLPSSFDKIFFSDNGSTSVEVAIKLALHYWYNKGIPRKKIIAIEGAYHGDTFGAMAVGARSVFSEPFSELLFDVCFISFPTEANALEVATQFETYCGSNEIAAFIYEPLVQGASGMRMYAPQILNQLLHIASRYEVLCIADEVMTGFGRTGKLFASEYMSLAPDLICLSKGITGGFMPLAVTAISKTIADAFVGIAHSKRFYHGHSYTGNTLACAAANASLELLLSEHCQEQIKMIAQQHAEYCRAIAQHPKVRKVSSVGTILSIELNTEEATSYFNNLRDFLYNFFLDRSILLRPLGNVVYVLPPYVISKQELLKIYSAISELLDTL